MNDIFYEILIKIVGVDVRDFQIIITMFIFFNDTNNITYII